MEGGLGYGSVASQAVKWGILCIAVGLSGSKLY